MSRIGFLHAHCWLDPDGTHVWLMHMCDERGEQTTVLPWPTWRAVNGRVEPSISCDDCGLHFFGTIEVAP